MKEEIVIGWVSRHPPIRAQIKWLYDKFKEFTITRISKTFRDAKEVIEELREKHVTHAVVILPLSMIAKLLQETKDIVFLWPEMEKIQELPRDTPRDEIKNFNEETDVLVYGRDIIRHFRFKEFKKIVKLELVLEPF